MTREEAIEILTTWIDDLKDSICSDCHYDDCKGRENDCCDRYHALEKIKEAGQFIINNETDLLKEFVEFAKGEFIKANYCYNDTYLDTMLDMFLEERK